MSTIRHKRSTVSGKAPLATDLVAGELALNTTDVKLYTKNTAGAVTTINTWENIHDKPAVALAAVSEIAGEPTTSDIPAGQWGIFKNTNTNTIQLWANNSGTLVKVTLA